MNASDDKRIDILVSALEERYKSIHEIRKRLQDLSIWVLGILLAASGWLFQSDVYFLEHEQITLIVVLILLVVLVFNTYIKDLEKGFKAQQIAAAAIEIELGFYDEGILAEKALYPQSWKSSGTKNGIGKYFSTNRILIITGVGLLALTVLMKGAVII